MIHAICLNKSVIKHKGSQHSGKQAVQPLCGQHSRVNPVDRGEDERGIASIASLVYSVVVETRKRCCSPFPHPPPAGKGAEPRPYHMRHSREWALHQLDTFAELILLAEVWGEPALKFEHGRGVATTHLSCGYVWGGEMPPLPHAPYCLLQIR